MISLQPNRCKLFLLLSTFLFSEVAFPAQVKKSISGICHDANSPSYSRIKNYIEFDSLKSCLNTGGRLPKNIQVGASTSNSIQKDALSLEKYSRSKFGNGWADLDKDCQNARMEALIAYSVGHVQFKSSKHCKVKSGKWISPFTGKIIYDASNIDIDHVVPLSWAWKHGAASWTNEMRVKFANDPANLLSVEASLNRQKGDKGIDKWLPPKNKCQYINRFIRVYKLYGLNLEQKEVTQFTVLKQKYC